MKDQVAQLLEKALEEHPDLFLLELNISEANQIRVVIDGDQGVKLSDCMAISRAIEHNLDRDKTDFSLEVLSAGVSEPLKLPRQYRKNVGRKLKLTTSSETIEGKLTEADENGVRLRWKAREPKPVGKGKITVEKEAEVPYQDIVEAKVMVTFN